MATLANKILDLGREAILSGVWPNGHPDSIPLWVDGRNVEYQNGAIGSMRGWSAPFVKPTADPIRGMAQLYSSGVQNLFFASPSAIYHWNASSVSTVGSGYSGYADETVTHPASIWSMVPWGSWIVATNGKDAPQVYKGSSFAALSGVTFSTAEIFLRRGPHVIAINTSNGGNWVEWCDEDDIELWAPAADNAAGNLIIRDMESDAVAAVPIGNQIAVYGKDSMHLLEYKGKPLYFGFRPALEGIGALSKHAVTTVGRRNFGVCQRGFFMTDGVQFKFIDDPVRDFFFDNLNQGQKSKIICWHDELTQQVRWSFPTSTDEPDITLGYDYERKSWYVYDFGRTAALPKEVFKWPVAGAADGEVYFHNYGSSADGADLTSWVQTKAYDFGDESVNKYIDAIKLGVSNLSGTVELQLGTQNRLDDALSWSSAMTVDDGIEPLYPRGNARYAALKISSTGGTWRLHSVAVHGEPVGGAL